MSLSFHCCPIQWFLIPTMVLDADHHDDGEGDSSIAICFLCFALVFIF